MHVLRDYQTTLKMGVYQAWQENKRNVLVVSPTGSGKTEVKASIFSDCRRPAVAIAHRQELVGQISNAIARAGVYHRIIAPKSVISFCISQHIKLFGRSFHHHNSPMAVAGVDTLLARSDDLVQWCNLVEIWDIDEAHHVLRANKWGKAVQLFPRAWGVGFTASPIRCDKKGLGRIGSGVFDSLVVGPTMRDLIGRGYLSDYIIYGPKPSFVMDADDIGPSGEFKEKSVRLKAHKSQITGDVIDHYLKLAPGKQGITFCVDIEIATETAAAFRQKGVPAECISSKTADAIRVKFIDDYRQGRLKQLVNVDLFGEGMDVPAVEVVSMGRPTQSWAVFAQQFGRMMRVAAGKTRGILIDHVGNVKLHGLPDRERIWSLEDGERRKKKSASEEMPVTTCRRCFRAYEAVTKACPFCGYVDEPSSRGAPEFVDGDLIEYGPELLATLGAKIARIDGRPLVPVDASPVVSASIQKRWHERQEAQGALRDSIALWAGVQREVYQRSDSESYRRFYHTFGIDVLSAQALDSRPEIEKLTAMVRESFT